MQRTPQASAVARPSWPADVAASLLVAGAAAFVFRGALRYGFSQDDFTGLARAAGLAPRLLGPWRWISQQFFFDAMRRLAGLDAAAYHAVSLGAHALVSVLLYAWLTRWTSRAGALVGAAFFGCHATAFTALYWTAAIGDVGALGFAIAALLLAGQAGRVRWLALPAFLLSLLCKESTLLLPVVAFAAARASHQRVGAPERRSAARDPVVLGLAVVAVAFALWLARAGSGTAPEGSSLAPYAVALGSNLGVNLLTYLGWSADAFVATVHGFSDGVDRSVFAPGAALAVVPFAGSILPAFRARGWTVATAWVLAFLAPVLVLRNHVYHYYLYAALPGVAWLLAIAFDVAMDRVPTTGLRAGLAGALALALAANGAALVTKIETEPLLGRESRADPIVDRALVASRALASVRAADLPPGSRLWFWSPERMLAGGRMTAIDEYGQRNARDALQDGLGVRVCFPQVDSCTFVDAPGEGRADDRFALYHLDGRATIVTRAALDTLLRDMPRPAR